MPRPASRTGLSPSLTPFSKGFRSRFACNVAVLQPHRGVATTVVWALPRSLATTGGIIKLFSLPEGTKMFQFPSLAPPKGGKSEDLGCPIRISTGQRPFAPHRGFSQLITSFFA